MRVVIVIDDTNPTHAGFIRLDATKTGHQRLIPNKQKLIASFLFAPSPVCLVRLSPVLSPSQETVSSAHQTCGLSEATHRPEGANNWGFAKRHPNPSGDGPSWRGLSSA
jgi:hypothetical protein